MKKSLIIFLAVLFLCTCNLFAANIEVTITEDSTLEDRLDGNYDLRASGIIKIYNPSNDTSIYEYQIPFYITDPYVNIGFLNTTPDKYSLVGNKIRGRFLEPGTTTTAEYIIYGRINYSLYDYVTKNDISIFEYYVNNSEFEFIPNVLVSLNKPSREYENSTNESRRLVTAEIVNDNDLNLHVRNLTVYVSNVSSPMFNSTSILATYSNFYVNGYGFQLFDVFDYSATDYSVYWISSDAVVDHNFSSNYAHSYVYGVGKTPSRGGGGGGGGGGIPINQSDEDEEIDSNLISFKKSSDKSLVKNGEEMEVTLRIFNNNDLDLENVQIEEEIPEGFELIDQSVFGEFNENTRKLVFRIIDIAASDIYEIKYTLVNKDKFEGVTYFKPASMKFEDITKLSEGLVIVHEAEENNRIFIQKEVEDLNDEFSKVTIRVRNLGNIAVSDLIISDNIDDNASIKQISKAFFDGKRGIWNIERLNSGDEWEVSYLIDKGADYDTIPNLYGVEKSDVYGILISSKEVVFRLNEEESVSIEKIGLGVAIGIILFYLLF